MLKTCYKCKQEKPLDEFYKNKKTKEGLQWRCKECMKKDSISFREENPEYMKNWQKANPEYGKNWYRENVEKAKEYSAQRREKNAEHIKKRRKTDPLFKLAANTRAAVSNSLKSGKNGKCTMEIVGCSIEELKEHLESQFKPGMTWDNYGRGGWSVDHLLPLSSAKTKKRLLQLWAYTNLQPLWEKENISKGAKYTLNDMFKHYYYSGGKK